MYIAGGNYILTPININNYSGSVYLFQQYMKINNITYIDFINFHVLLKYK